LLRQLTSSELSELIAYSELHPISPGQERMLAKLTHMVSIGGGIKVDGEHLELGDFQINTLDRE
jgi:hypothetical protein